MVNVGDANDLLGGARVLKWTAPVTAKRGDVALFYVGGPGSRAIYAVGLTTEDPDPGEKADYWGRNKKGRAHFARYKNLNLLDVPLPLATIRMAFPKWGQWTKLFGVRVHTVPDEYRVPLAKRICADNPGAKALLAPWLRGNSRPPSIENDELAEMRYEGSSVTRRQVVYERVAEIRRRAIAASHPPFTCVVCGFNFEAAYGLAGKGFIEVHHKKLLSHGRRKRRASDLAVLCSNCHSMAHWRSGDEPRTVADLQRQWRANGS